MVGFRHKRDSALYQNIFLEATRLLPENYITLKNQLQISFTSLNFDVVSQDKTMVYYTGYEANRDLSSLARQLNVMVRKAGQGSLKTVVTKYSHK